MGYSREDLQSIFHEVGPRYNLMKALLSFGLERRMKRAALAHSVQPPGTWIDLASGTGDILLEVTSSYYRVGVDLSLTMLELLRSREPPPGLIQADINMLPFRDESADVVSMAYGLRYAQDLPQVLTAVHRLLKPGGAFFAFDLDLPARPFRYMSLAYIGVIGTILGLALHGRAGTYWHLVQTLKEYPGRERVRQMLQQTGFSEVSARRVLLGTMAAHYARKG